jgi:hypothetical protein
MPSYRRYNLNPLSGDGVGTGLIVLVLLVILVATTCR